MKSYTTRTILTAGMFAILAVALLGGLGGLARIHAAPQIQTAPISFSAVSRAVMARLATNPTYQNGDLITQSKVTPALNDLGALGWPVPDKQAILSRVLPDSDFLATALSSPKGIVFMRQIEKLPLAFDKLDRLSRQRYGQNNVNALIQGPGGSQFLEYLTQASGGTNMGTMLSGEPGVGNFNQPTGRIYTADQLLAALKKQYSQSQTIIP